MAKKRNVRALLRKQLGEDAAAAVLKKADEMVKQGASPAKIRKELVKDIAAHIAEGLTDLTSIAM